mmetsp:Transcript_116921/g.229366  ORF Transcript_116921/g.229366 Transcript_116921/m.229366 type:complete len:250 (-) Transcript_116921:146-895(-)
MSQFLPQRGCASVSGRRPILMRIPPVTWACGLAKSSRCLWKSQDAVAMSLWTPEPSSTSHSTRAPGRWQCGSDNWRPNEAGSKPIEIRCCPRHRRLWRARGRQQCTLRARRMCIRAAWYATGDGPASHSSPKPPVAGIEPVSFDEFDAHVTHRRVALGLRELAHRGEAAYRADDSGEADGADGQRQSETQPVRGRAEILRLTLERCIVRPQSNVAPALTFQLLLQASDTIALRGLLLALPILSLSLQSA